MTGIETTVVAALAKSLGEVVRPRVGQVLTKRSRDKEWNQALSSLEALLSRDQDSIVRKGASIEEERKIAHFIYSADFHLMLKGFLRTLATLNRPTRRDFISQTLTTALEVRNLQFPSLDVGGLASTLESALFENSHTEGIGFATVETLGSELKSIRMLLEKAARASEAALSLVELQTLARQIGLAVEGRFAMIDTPHWDRTIRRPLLDVITPVRIAIRGSRRDLNASARAAADRACSDVVAELARLRVLEAQIEGQLADVQRGLPESEAALRLEAEEESLARNQHEPRPPSEELQAAQRALALAVRNSPRHRELRQTQQRIVNEILRLESLDPASGATYELANSVMVRTSTTDTFPRRLVVVGDPGAGKTTFTALLCYRASRGEAVIASSRDDSVPPAAKLMLPIALRDYQVRTPGQSFAAFLADWISGELEVPTTRAAIETMLLLGLVDVVFDAMDELLVQASRRTVRDHIESFAEMYQDVAVIVTSRLVGYELAPLDDRVFALGRIQPYDDAERRAYVKGFYDTHPRIPVQDQERIAARLLANIGNLTDIASNPLMLGLLANLFDATNNRDLPQTRCRLYRRASIFLYERWDAERGMDAWDFEHTFLPVVAHIAFAMASGEVAAHASADDLREVVAGHYPDSPKELVEERFQMLLRIASGRAWVLQAVGADGGGEPLFGFSHRTFAEYFAALHLHHRATAQSSFASAIGRRLREAPDDLVAELAFEIRCDEFNLEADVVVFAIARQAERSSQWRVARFLARGLRNVEIYSPSALMVPVFMASLELSSDPSELEPFFEDLVYTHESHRAVMFNALIDSGLLFRREVGYLVDYYSLHFTRWAEAWSPTREREVDPRLRAEMDHWPQR